jgi:tetratricopeptide (TPR) repeat protein
LPRRAPRLRPARGVVALVLAALFAGGCTADALHEDVGAANRLYEEERYEEALTAYEKLLAQRPDVPEIAYNAGNTLNRLGNYERAIAETQRSLPPKTSKLGAASYYGLGNHYLALGQQQAAYEAYRNALLLDPNDADAKYNLELTLLQLEPPPPPPGEGPGPGEQPQQPSGDQGQPNPQSQPGQPQGSPQPGPQATPQPSPAELQRSLQEALRGIDENLTFEQAIEILDLLELQEGRPLPAQPGAPSGPDY